MKTVHFIVFAHLIVIHKAVEVNGIHGVRHNFVFLTLLDKEIVNLPGICPDHKSLVKVVFLVFVLEMLLNPFTNTHKADTKLVVFLEI